MTKAHFLFSIYPNPATCLRSRKSKNQDERKIHKIPPKFGTAMLCFRTVAFYLRSLGGPIFLRLGTEDWGEEEGNSAKAGDTLTQSGAAGTPTWLQRHRPDRGTRGSGRSHRSAIVLSPMPVRMNATERPNHWATSVGAPPSPGRQQTSRALPPAHTSGGFAPTGPEREGARHEAPPRSLLTCSAAASPDMASGDYNVHTGRQGEARKEKLS